MTVRKRTIPNPHVGIKRTTSYKRQRGLRRSA